MHVYHFPEGPAPGSYLMLVSDLLETEPFHTGEWQAMDTSKSALHKTHELEDVSLVWDRVPTVIDDIFPAIDYDWADDHFLERVSGQPLNPPPSHTRWPYAVRDNGDHTNGTQFDHTYPERFWPVHAGMAIPPGHVGELPADYFNHGIRFPYGDLMDVAGLLATKPLTRQAYLPVWFPEDTGATEGQRVPCTLGYHFMQRGGRLSCRYYLRSCDVYRHLSNDVYFAARLMDWICDKVYELTEQTEAPIYLRPGSLVVHISSLHAFVGDTAKIKDRMEAVSHDRPL